MAKRPGDLFPVIIGGSVILLALFFHSIYEDLLKAAVLKRLSALMDMPEAELLSRLTEMSVPIIGAVAVIWLVLLYARRELRAEIPDSALEAQRQHTAAILAQTEAWNAVSARDITVPNQDANYVAPQPGFIAEGCGAWESAEGAIESFAGLHLINERNKWRETFQESYLAMHEARDKIAALQNTMGGIFGTDEAGELGANRRKFQVAQMQHDMAKEELREAWNALRADLEVKLANGTLIAKGFLAPHIAGSAEATIAPAEWRVLTLNNAQSEALRKWSAEVLYSGLLIRKIG